MTVGVGFYCHDGVVIGADSMLTPSMGNINVGHHKGQKVHVLGADQLFAFAGDQGQAARFQTMAGANLTMPTTVALPLDYPLWLTQNIIQQFTATGIGNQINVNALLGFVHQATPQLCVFEGMVQPRLLDSSHYYVALGSGKLSADPFLRFLVDIFCVSGMPSVSEATLLTAWTIQHVIDTNPGGVSGPIKIAVIEKDTAGVWAARMLTDNEIDDHQQAVGSAMDALRDWRAGRSTGGAGAPPKPPTAPPAPQKKAAGTGKAKALSKKPKASP